jgi:outer membrane lipopolysaccharide assembly protein LptE/RlpB
MKRRVTSRWILGVLVIALAGCGYQFAGGGSLPGGISRVFITMLENRSSQSGIESIFTNDLINEFTTSREASLVRDRSQADGILTGAIVGLSVDNISRASISTALERRVTGTLNLRLESRDGQVLWSSGNLVDHQDFAVGDGDQATTDSNQRQAIVALSRKMAQTAFNRMTDDF